MITPQQASGHVISINPDVVDKINKFCADVLTTRGGRLGSGMGGLIEALWGYFTNKTLWRNEHTKGIEIGWIADHEYNDFACILTDSNWDESTRQGELFRIEAKSMNIDVEESKGHFDELKGNLTNGELLIVLLWNWESVGNSNRVCPKITDSFIDHALPIAELRDELHLMRGGYFNSISNCKEKSKCDCSNECLYDGEPINSRGVKERRAGPPSARSAKVEYAANFGGLIRMLKTSSDEMRNCLFRHYQNNKVAKRYISFIHRNFRKEEKNTFKKIHWQNLANSKGVESNSIDEIQSLLRERNIDYHSSLVGIAKSC